MTAADIQRIADLADKATVVVALDPWALQSLCALAAAALEAEKAMKKWPFRESLPTIARISAVRGAS